MFIALLAMVSVVSAALPAPVSASITYSLNHDHYWIVDVTAGPTELPVGVGYNSWCSDILHTIGNGPHTFTAYSSIDPLLSSQYTGPSADWNKVNWIINNKNADSRITQAAIWHYDGAPTGDPTNGAVSGYSHDAYINYLALVDQHGSFVPTCGQLYAVILYSDTLQVIFVERPTTTCDPGIPVPEFPSLALPAGMMIGMVGLVYFARGREN